MTSGFSQMAMQWITIFTTVNVIHYDSCTTEVTRSLALTGKGILNYPLREFFSDEILIYNCALFASKTDVDVGKLVCQCSMPPLVGLADVKGYIYRLGWQAENVS